MIFYDYYTITSMNFEFKFISFVQMLILIQSFLFQNTNLTPLHCAAASGNLEIIQMFIEAKADVDAKTQVRTIYEITKS